MPVVRLAPHPQRRLGDVVQMVLVRLQGEPDAELGAVGAARRWSVAVAGPAALICASHMMILLPQAPGSTPGSLWP